MPPVTLTFEAAAIGATGVTAANDTGHVHAASEAALDDAPSEDDSTEGARIGGHYKFLIAAARGTLKGRDATAMVRRLRNEKILAVRAAKARRFAARANRRSSRLAPMARHL